MNRKQNQKPWVSQEPPFGDPDTTVRTIPVLGYSGDVFFPGEEIQLSVHTSFFLSAVQAALAGNRLLFLAFLDDPTEDEPTPDELHPVGVLASIHQAIEYKNGNIELILRAKSRAWFHEADFSGAFPTVDYHLFPTERSDALDAACGISMDSLRGFLDSFQKYIDFDDEAKETLQTEQDPEKWLTLAISVFPLSKNQKFTILDKSSILDQILFFEDSARNMIETLAFRVQLQEAFIQKYQHETRRQLLLNEQRHITEELRALDLEAGKPPQSDSSSDADYIARIEALPLDEDEKRKLYRSAHQLEEMSPASQEALVIQNQLDTVLDLPWKKESKAAIHLERAKKILDQDHYGLTKVKESILDHFAVQVLNPAAQGKILCLVGPPGIGKTSVGDSIARAVGRVYERISLGGMRDEAEFRGHRKTYVGAMPGQIIDAIARAGTNNPLILLDEVDKISSRSDSDGNPAAALLEVLDPEQNCKFRDRYLEVPFDLSHVLFVATANSEAAIPVALRDRLEIITLDSYTREEKFHIAKEHLVSKNRKLAGLKETQFRCDDDALYALIDGYTRESGVRELERCIASLCRKAARRIVSGEAKRVIVLPDTLQDFLGSKKFHPEKKPISRVGVALGLAWTPVGGVMMPIEVLPLAGRGNIQRTGSLGDVMKESTEIAVSWARSVAATYEISEDFYKKTDIHIHAPEGAIPKDGPSAGVTIATAIISALSNRLVREDVAMTGEITLHGDVLPIGGLKEKSIAAYRAGIQTVIIPEENIPDLDEIDDEVRAAIHFRPVKNLNEVMEIALLSPEKGATL